LIRELPFSTAFTPPLLSGEGIIAPPSLYNPKPSPASHNRRRRFVNSFVQIDVERFYTVPSPSVFQSPAVVVPALFRSGHAPIVELTSRSPFCTHRPFQLSSWTRRSGLPRVFLAWFVHVELFLPIMVWFLLHTGRLLAWFFDTSRSPPWPRVLHFNTSFCFCSL